MAAEVSKILVLSTAHLSQETWDRLKATDSNAWGHSGNLIDYGLFMYAHDERPTFTPELQCPDDVWAACVKARELGADYLKFDCDAEEVEGLATYEHRLGG